MRLAVFACIVCAAAVAAGDVIYVNSAATGVEDGNNLGAR